jgi:hypothetical protein
LGVAAKCHAAGIIITYDYVSKLIKLSIIRTQASTSGLLYDGAAYGLPNISLKSRKRSLLVRIFRRLSSLNGFGRKFSPDSGKVSVN